ncbi:MAG TPA: sodium:calcium antiporter [Verrucomicrobiae bacterium]|nr:sodium:calcium antiporter [Verrucomicrobiae bacterium]
MKDIAILLLSLGIILLGAETFTNGIEWLGKRLGLGAGAVGSILAAVGTALPETMVPIIAIVFGRGDTHASEVGIGAILGAPFMLGTLAFFISGLAAMLTKVGGRRRTYMLVDKCIIERDLRFFLISYSVAILVSFFPHHNIKVVAAAFLVGAYGYYAFQTIRDGACVNDEELPRLYVAPRVEFPGMMLIAGQVMGALLMIVVGAKFFVQSVEHLSGVWGIPAFILSLIITPIATELPEKFNSVIWIRQGKDTLALGNITGAMVFQSSIIPAIGIILTPWKLEPLALVSAVLALLAASVPFYFIKTRGRIKPNQLLLGGFFYLIFLIAILTVH